MLPITYGQCNLELMYRLCQSSYNALLFEVNNLPEMKSINENESLKDKQLITPEPQNSQTAVCNILANEGQDWALLNAAIILIKDSNGEKFVYTVF